MAVRIIKVLPQDRYVTQGISNIGGGRFSTSQPNSEVLTYKLDYERWLTTGVTISSYTATGSGCMVAPVNSSTYLTLTISAVSGSASVDVTIIASDGRSKQIVIAITEGRVSIVPAYIVSPESEAATEGYNNTDSNLAATNVQEAIDELAVAVSDGVNVSEVVFIFDGGNVPIAVNSQLDIPLPWACTINSWVLLADTNSTTVLDVWKDTYGNYPPTVADTITAAAKPALSASSKNTSSSLTGWTTAIAAGDTLRVNIDSNDLATRLSLGLTVTKT